MLISPVKKGAQIATAAQIPPTRNIGRNPRLPRAGPFQDLCVSAVRFTVDRSVASGQVCLALKRN
jgi:hypothetical protein